MSARVNLVYVASIGRSGSTLLETMLGAHDDIATMGETHIWPHELRRPERPCACGRDVVDCPFWIEVRGRCDVSTQPEPRLDHFRERHNGGKTLRPARQRDFRRGAVPRPGDAAWIRQYAQNSADAFRTYHDVFAEQQGRDVTWLVDSSKDPYRLAWFKHSGLLNLRVVHMVKQPEAFVYSVTKQYLRGPLASPVRRYTKALRQSGAWLVQNHLFSRLARNVLSEDEYLLLPYEEFAVDPAGAFRRVTDFIGVPDQPSAVTRFREGAIHTIAGNPMRYETRPIELDERWRTDMPAASKAIARLVSSPLRGSYGY